MRKLLLFVIIFIPSFCLANIHYVSKSGSATYPYASWETAAHSIMQTSEAAKPGDRVMVELGVHRRTNTFYSERLGL